MLASREAPDLEDALNREGKNGWRLRETFMLSGALGESDKIILIIEKEKP
jgi:hypothetical protein